MKKTKIAFLGLLTYTLVSVTSCAFFDLSYYETKAPSKDEMTLKWADDFNGDSLDLTKWKYETGKTGWGNNELQNYTNDSKVATIRKDSKGNGYLDISARYENGEWKSARLNSKQSWKYGYIEAQLLVTDKKGAWPAFWMMPKNSKYGEWPNSGEIDIMENAPSTAGLGNVFSSLHALGHYADKPKSIGKKNFGANFNKEWHKFGILWDETKITCYYDGVAQETYYNDDTGYKNWPYDDEFFVILNLAIGGNLGGTGDAASLQSTGAHYYVDYVHVYQ